MRFSRRFFAIPGRRAAAAPPHPSARSPIGGVPGGSGHGSAYAGEHAGSSGRPARLHIATLASANSTVSMLAFLARPR